MLFIFLLVLIGPSIYFGATHMSIIAALLWSLLGVGSAMFRAEQTHDDITSAWSHITERHATRLRKAAFKGLTISVPLCVAGYLMGSALAHSRNAGGIIEAIAFAYLLAGLYHFLSNLILPVIKQPSFVRRGAPGWLVGILFWLPPSFINLRWGSREMFARTLLTWLIFVAGSLALASI